MILTPHTKCRLQILNTSDNTVRFAAAELQKYLHKATGVKITIRKTETGNSPEGIQTLVLAGSFGKSRPNPPASAWFEKVSRLNPEGFGIRTDNNSLTIAGKSPKGLLNGVYAFLEKHAGIRFLAPEQDGEFVPKMARLKLGKIRTLSQPAIAHRALHVCGEHPYDSPQIDWMAKNRVNVVRFDARHWENSKPVQLPQLRKRGMTIYVGLHSAAFFMPSDKYFKKRPEYYAFTGGKRQTTQICYSDKGALATYIANVIAYLKRNPEIDIIGLWPNDGYGFCECPRCRDGYVGKTVLRFINEVAKAIYALNPATVVEHLSYANYIAPPKGIKPFKNVNVLYCPYWDRSKYHPVFDGRYGFPRSLHQNNNNCRGIVRNLNGWKKLTDNISIFSYYTDQIILSVLHAPIHRVMQADFQYYYALGFRGIHENNCVRSAWWMDNVNEYAYARSLWDPFDDSDKYVSEFFRHYYGPAGKAMEAYSYAMLKALQAALPHGFKVEDFAIGSDDANGVSDFNPAMDALSWKQMQELLKTAEGQLNRAARLAKAGPSRYRKRIVRMQSLAKHVRFRLEAYYQTAKLAHFFVRWEKRKGNADRLCALQTIKDTMPNLLAWRAYWEKLKEQKNADYNFGLFGRRTEGAIEYFQARFNSLMSGGGKIEDTAFRDVFDFDL